MACIERDARNLGVILWLLENRRVYPIEKEED